jgi:hypothetical protein
LTEQGSPRLTDPTARPASIDSPRLTQNQFATSSGGADRWTAQVETSRDRYDECLKGFDECFRTHLLPEHCIPDHLTNATIPLTPKSQAHYHLQIIAVRDART